MWLLACAAAGAVSAQPVDPDAPGASAPPQRYVLGMVATMAPEYPGSDRTVLKLRPLAAYQWGRFRISTSRAGAVLDAGADAAGPGASAELLTTDRWRIGAALRVDSGRQSSDSALLQGLPDIKRTLRGRVYASYALATHWQLGANVSQDLLGNQGGAVGGVELQYRQRLGERSTWTTGVGVALADRRNMSTYFGITGAQSAVTGMPAFQPDAGVRDIHAAVGASMSITPHWVLFGGVGATSLQGGAAASPLTRNPNSVSAHIGLAYRCCK